VNHHSPERFCAGCRQTVRQPRVGARVKRNPRGLPRTQWAQSPWTRTPRTRCSYSPCSRGMARTRPRPWTQSQSPARRTGETNTLPGWIEGSYPQIDLRPGASPGWPSRSPSSTASCTSVPRRASCSGAYPFPGARTPSIHSHGHVWPPRGAAHPRGQHIPLVLLLAHRGC
jgi:hypothetical protein